MIETAPNTAITALIHSLPALPKQRLIELWKENFGKTPGKIRPELMVPILAFRIQERAYGGLSAETKGRLRQVMGSLEPKRRFHNEARNRFKPGTRLVREWKGKTHEVILTGDGYDYLGQEIQEPLADRLRDHRDALVGAGLLRHQEEGSQKVSPARSTIRCAIYTRKSSEEGLEQSFNSLHAQREACEAYVLSQRHEGWQLLAAKYDDGGFSGGNMERPGLRKLLDDIASKKIDTVVVYKVDRLTRALSDFARIVETFDKQGVSFVSVTQQFNTTTSMGRLTLNVLLSFAQFEREVTGERIRDKVAASKKKGMWMGGPVPLGYDLSDRALIVNESEAKQVREIFDQYLRLGSVFDLYEHLKATSVRSKARVGPTGRVAGGAVLSRGTLYHLLRNPLYIGKIAHKGVLHSGMHAAIISDDVWQKTADLLNENRVRRTKSKNQSSDRLLLGILFDQEGNRFTPTHASKKGRRYTYYISQTLTEGRKTKCIQRIPATVIEQVVAARVRSLFSSQVELSHCFPSLSIQETRLLLAAGRHRGELLADLTLPEAKNVLRTVLKRVVVGESDVQIEVDRIRLQSELLGGKSVAQDGDASESVRLVCPFTIKRRGQQVRIVISAGGENQSRSIPSLMRVIARSRDWAELIVSGRARTLDDLVKASGLTRAYVKNAFQCVALSPPVIDAIVGGRHRVDLTVMDLTNDLSFDWNKQQL